MVESAIEAIKAYVDTDEGKEWFMNTLALAQAHMEQVGKRTIPATKDVAEGEKVLQNTSIPERTERNQKTLTVSKRELENVIQWAEKHPSPEKDGRYILRVTLVGGHQALKSALLMKGETVSNSQIVAEDPRKILSGEVTRVSTKGARVETFTIVLKD